MDYGIDTLVRDAQAFLPRVPELLVSFLIGYLIIKLVSVLFTHSLGIFRFPKALIAILNSLVMVILSVLLVANLLRLVGLGQLAVTLSGSLLVIGLAVANGANTLVSDIIAGLFLAKDPDFDIEFEVKSGETEGIVESIDIRKTRIRTKNGQLVIIPNSVLDKERLIIVNRPPNRRSRRITEMKEHYE